MRAIVSMLKNSRDTKVTNFDRSILVHKNVLSLQISVQNFPVMDMLDGQCHLNEPIKDLVLAVTDLTDLFLICNFGVQITPVGIVHDDAETSFVHKGLFVSDDVRMSHSLQDMDFVNGVFSLLAVHLGDIDDLHDVGLSVSYRLNKDCESERAFSNYF